MPNHPRRVTALQGSLLRAGKPTHFGRGRDSPSGPSPHFPHPDTAVGQTARPRPGEGWSRAGPTLSRAARRPPLAQEHGPCLTTARACVGRGESSSASLWHQPRDGKHSSICRSSREVMTSFDVSQQFFPCLPFTFLSNAVFIIPISISNVVF